MLLNPFALYDAMLGIREEDDYEEVETVFVTREIPEDLVDEFNASVDKFLSDNGYDPLDFDSEEE